MKKTGLRLATCSYSEFTPAMGLPVRFTAGVPKFVRYPLAGHAKLITPTWQMVKMTDRAAYEFLYRRLLNANGLDRISRELQAIGRQSTGSTLVLLCYERLSEPGKWCHRTMFAAWWQEQTGEEVPELGSTHTHPGLF